MKKLNRKTSKLNLQTETLNQLTQSELKQVAGGVSMGECYRNTQSCNCPTMETVCTC